MNCLLKKYRQFVAVLVDHTNERVLDVLEGRDKDLIVNYLRKQGGAVAAVEKQPTDMWDGYVNAVKEVFGQTFRRDHRPLSCRQELPGATDSRTPRDSA